MHFRSFSQILKKSCIEILAAEPSSICAGGKMCKIPPLTEQQRKTEHVGSFVDTGFQFSEKPMIAILKIEKLIIEY